MAYSLGNVLPHVKAAANEIGPKFGIRTIYGWAAQGSVSGSLHPLGRALDFMCSTSQGDQIVSYAMANRDRLGITEVIWNRRIATKARGWTWRQYTGPRSHTDHVHLSFNSSGGTGGAANAIPDLPGPLEKLPGAGSAWEAGEAAGDAYRQVQELATLVNKAATWATDKKNWINLLMILIGLLLVIVALWRTTNPVKVGMKIVKAVK